jgi:hypothetical protein
MCHVRAHNNNNKQQEQEQLGAGGNNGAQSGPRPGGLAPRLRETRGTEVRGRSPLALAAWAGVRFALIKSAHIIRVPLHRRFKFQMPAFSGELELADGRFLGLDLGLS